MFPSTFQFHIINETQKQYSLLDTKFNYIMYFEPPWKRLYLSPQTHYMWAGEAGRHVVCFLCFCIESGILYLAPVNKYVVQGISDVGENMGAFV